MTLTGMKKHVGVLEQAGLVSTEKVGRVRTCKLGLRGLEEEAAWIERHRQLWAARFDELDVVVEEMKRQEEIAEVRLEGPKGRNAIAKGEALEPGSAALVRALKGRNSTSEIASKEKANGRS